LAHSSRTWQGARTPQAIKRVRQAERRHAILQPRRSAAKTYVARAAAAAATGDEAQTRESLLLAVSALDRAAKVGAIHPNAAARRKSRLMLKINAALGGEAAATAGKSQRQTGRAAATQAAKSRIAAGRATKAKGEQTAAGKARAALSRSTRQAGSPTDQDTAASERPAAPPTKARRATSRSTTAGTDSTSSTATKPASSRAATKSAESKASTVRSVGPRAKSSKSPS